MNVVILMLLCTVGQPGVSLAAQGTARRVTVGDGTASGQYVEPYKASYRLTRYDSSGDSTRAGHWTDEVRLLDHRTPHEVWRRVERFDATGARDLVRVQIVNRETLAPSVTHQVGPSDLVLHYALHDRHISLVHIPAPEQLEAWILEDSLPEVPFDLGLYALLLRGFPLQSGASFSFPVAAVVPGRGVTLIEETLTVTGISEVERSGRRVEAWIVETAFRPWVVWLTQDPPYIARLEQRFPDGTRWVSVPMEGHLGSDAGGTGGAGRWP